MTFNLIHLLHAVSHTVLVQIGATINHAHLGPVGVINSYLCVTEATG